MTDEITKLCFRLIRADKPEDLRPAATELKKAIRERFDAVRENALEIVLLDRLVQCRVPGSGNVSQSEENNLN